MGYVVNELFRFRMLMAGVYVGIAISSTYGFAVLTEDMKVKFNFSQGDITTISTVGNCVGYLSFFAGMLFDYAGPKVVLPIAGSCGFIGFLLFGLALDGKLNMDRDETMKNTILFSIFNAILYLGCPAMDVATIMPLMMNFPVDRGYMVVIQKTFSGLGTSVLMAYFNGFFRNVNHKESSAYSSYVYFVACQILFCSFLGAFFIDLPPYVMTQYRRHRSTEEEIREHHATLKIFMTQRAPRLRLYIGCALVVINLVFLTIISIVTGYVQTSHKAYLTLAIIAAVILALFALMALPCQLLGKYYPVEHDHEKFPILGWVSDPSIGDPLLLEAEEDTSSSQEKDGENDNNADKQNSNAVTPVEDGENAVAESPVEEEEAEAPKPIINSVGQPQYGDSFWKHLLTPDLWLLWFSFFGMWGTGTVMQMNATQIYRSKNYGVFDPARNTLYVALIGVGSAIGRIFSGVVDMYLTKRRQEQEPELVAALLAECDSDDDAPKRKSPTVLLTTLFLPFGPLALFIAYLLFAVVPADALIVPFLIGSIGIGVGWGLGSLAVRIMYANDVGKHYNFMFSSGFICTIALNRFMFGDMYDNEAYKYGTYPFCNRPSCVRNQMFILMAVNALSTVTALVAHIRFAWFVEHEMKVTAQKIRDAQAELAEEPAEPTAPGTETGSSIEYSAQHSNGGKNEPYTAEEQRQE